MFEWPVPSHSRPEGPSQSSSCRGGASETAAAPCGGRVVGERLMVRILSQGPGLSGVITRAATGGSESFGAY